MVISDDYLSHILHTVTVNSMCDIHPNIFNKK